jgi:hypothetical protein
MTAEHVAADPCGVPPAVSLESRANSFIITASCVFDLPTDIYSIADTMSQVSSWDAARVDRARKVDTGYCRTVWSVSSDENDRNRLM